MKKEKKTCIVYGDEEFKKEVEKIISFVLIERSFLSEKGLSLIRNSSDSVLRNAGERNAYVQKKLQTVGWCDDVDRQIFDKLRRVFRNELIS